MRETKLGAVETRFAEIIWRNEPMSSGTLAALCADELGWKKSTTYTVLKKLCGRGIFRNDGGTVTAVMSRGEFLARQGEEFLERTFSGSLPAFIAAFTARNRLSEKDIADIRQLIEAGGKEQ